MSEDGERLSDSDSSQLLALGENGESDAESEVSDDLRLQTYGSDFGTAGRKVCMIDFLRLLRSLHGAQRRERENADVTVC